MNGVSSYPAIVRQSVAGLRLLLAMTLLLGLLYPVAIWGFGRLMPGADGSFVTSNGREVGSSLIGQSFEGAQWFHARPSEAGDGYDALASAASNLGPENADLLATIEERRTAIAALEGVAPGRVPPDAVTASASGLDPHISPEYARLQVARVARERGLPEAEVASLVERLVQGRTLGFLGEPRVNVLELNLALGSAAR